MIRRKRFEVYIVIIDHNSFDFFQKNTIRSFVENKCVTIIQFYEGRVYHGNT